MKKIIISLLLILFAISFSLGMACGKPKEDAYLNLSHTNLVLSLGDEKDIIAETSNSDGYSLVWSSDDSNIVKVVNGKVTAIGFGETIVRAQYSNGENVIEKTVTVQVQHGDKVAILNIESDNYWRIPLNCVYTIMPSVTFDGQVYTDGVVLTAKDYDQTVVTVENNSIKAIKVGKTQIVFEGSYRGMVASDAQPLLRCVVTVEVIDDYQVFINGGSAVNIELFTVDEFNGESYDTTIPFVVEIRKNSTQLNITPSIKVSNTNVVSYSNNSLSALKYGETDVIIEWEEDGVKKEKSVSVKVNCPTIDDVIEFDATNGQIDFSNIEYIAGNEISSIIKEGVYGKNIYDDGKLEIEFDDIKIKSDRSDVENMPLIVELQNGEFYRLANFKPYTRIFNQNNKDEIVSTFVQNSGAEIKGYYLLECNIDGITFKRTVQDTFSGVFDGRGYTINGVSVAGCGLFGNYASGATVKNVAFTNVDFGTTTISYYNQKYLLFNGPAHNKVDNVNLSDVYVTIKPLTSTVINKQSTYFAGLMHNLSGSASNKWFSNEAKWNINNVIVEMPFDNTLVEGTDYTRQFAGSFAALGYISESNISNAYVVSNLPAIGNSSSSAGKIIHYSNIADMENASADYSSFIDVWDIESNLPVWKTYVQLDIKNSENLSVDTDKIIISKTGNETYSFTFNYGGRTLIPTAINLPDDCTELVVEENTVTAGVISAEVSISVEVVFGEISKKVDIKVTPYEIVSTVVDLDTTSGKLYLPSEFNTKTISDVIFNGSSVYTAGKITGIVPTIKADRSDVESIVLAVEFTDDTSIKFTNVKPYTAIFTQDNKNEIVSTFIKNNGSTNDGYYVLGGNIDGISFNRTAQDTFSGVFDGRGYYIKNMSVVGKGLFGDYGNGITIKNVAFIDMDFGAPTWNNYGLLYTNNGTVTTAKIENVYISVKEITATTAYNNNTNLTYFAPLAYKLSQKDIPWHLNNIIIDVPVASSITVNGSWSSGFAVYCSFSSAENISNCYVISSLKTIAQPSDNAFNILKFSDKAAMIAASKNYSSFANSGYWTVEASDIPVWKLQTT